MRAGIIGVKVKSAGLAAASFAAVATVATFMVIFSVAFWLALIAGALLLVRAIFGL